MATMGLAAESIIPTCSPIRRYPGPDGSSNGAIGKSQERWQSTLNRSFQTLPANPLVRNAEAIDAGAVEAMKKAEYMEDWLEKNTMLWFPINGEEIWPLY